jgi:hypothetical protein
VSFESEPEIRIDTIQEHIISQLNTKDRNEFLYLLYRNDNKNLLYILRKKKRIQEAPLVSFHTPSAFTYQELEEGMIGINSLPEYMNEFLRITSGNYEGRKTENYLTQLYFEECIQRTGDFLSNYFTFKRDVKNIVSALNAKKFNYNLSDALIGTGDIVNRIMKSTTIDLGLGKNFPFIDDLIALIDQGNFQALERRVDSILFDYLTANAALDRFSREAVYEYFLRLSLISRWIQLNTDKGSVKLKQILDWVISTGSLPTELSMENTT